ncbi:PTS cellbiose transporter subunit IIB [Spongiactinospora gelatinilytica]|uniref:PTS cellbiose transporter subunit IIB n=1 Tax=Spongiactinospora gelatinilytica TaxID=2666298 RepID=A0A2W2GIV3_9ACTN|nr:PTS sugar transporter subunit IIB [Spongiactinospora gelatinilytica]PZG37078.1 PTS cellbiose transporter subunit IIB [Spongiactinospora gelatinilytica]
MALDRRLDVLAVCGVGMGTSLMLKMTAEDALNSLGVDARVENTDIGSARGMSPDVVIGQGMHTSELEDLAPVVITVSDFLDKEGLVEQLRERLSEKGWLA